MSLAITPETKVGALLDAYPEIEDALIGLVPAFAKLRNPILRRTVAKVATLEQAAKIGGISIRDLVGTLRKATGQPDTEMAQREAAGGADAQPEWDERSIRFDIDADKMLEAGEHPIGKVRQSAERLGSGEKVRLTSSFLPAPLIDAFQKSGFQVHSSEPVPGRHETYIWKHS